MSYPSQKKFSSLYEREKKKIDARVEKALKKRAPSSLYKPGEYILTGKGKRVRPLLVLLSAKAAGGKFNQVYNAAVAVELLHNFTLVHDDIMDNADKRRGRMTLHKKIDINTAILVGDSLLSVAYEFLLKDCNGNTKFVVNSFTKSLVEVCEGQSLDTDFEKRKNVSMEEYLTMIKKKTAAMIRMCCEIGAALGGATGREIKAISNYGLNLGIAFQIQDDLLDITADENKFGKRIGGDLIEGKKTFLFIDAFSKAKGEDKKALLRVIDNRGIKPAQVKKYKTLFDKLGVIDEAKKAIDSYTKKALKSLSIIRKKEDKEILIWLADRLLNRTK